MENDEISRFKKVTNHLKRHRTIYITAGVCFVGGAVAGGLYFKTFGMNPQINQKAVALFNSTINQTAVQVTIDAPGNSGNVIKDLTTGAIYPSQNAAAKALGVDAQTLSRHISGKLPNVKGHTFEKLIDGGASHVLKAA